MAIWVTLLAALGEPDELVLLAGGDVHAAARARAATASGAARHLRSGWTRSLTGCSPPGAVWGTQLRARSPGLPAGERLTRTMSAALNGGAPCRSTS